MVAFVTPQEAADQIRLDLTVSIDSRWVNLWIGIVSASIVAWLKDEWRAYEVERDADGAVIEDSNGDPILILDTSDEPIVLPGVVGATLLELASQYRYREGEGDNVVSSDAGYGYVLSKGATALLAPYRRSTVA